MDKQSIYDDQTVNYNWKKISDMPIKTYFSNETVFNSAFGEEEKI